MDTLSHHASQKQCTTCKRFFPATPEFFAHDKQKKEGLRPQCKSCQGEYREVYISRTVAERELIPPSAIPSEKRCGACNAILPATPEFWQYNKWSKDGLRARCKSCSSRNHRPAHSERFWSKVDKSGECWLWTGTITRSGYGRFTYRHGENTFAHRIAWELTYGSIPDDLWVLHHCDNPLCVRPDHLFLGTHTDNMKDCAVKGRMFLQRNPMRTPWMKLTEAQVREIRQLYAQGGVSQSELARKYQVNQSTIHLIVSGKTWRHLVDPPPEEEA